MTSTNLFKHVAIFGDIHFGNKNNSRQFNDDCEDFIIWFIKEAKKRNCDTCIFLGDFHHQRASVNVSTLNYGVSNLKRLSENFETVYLIIGNHDLFYRQSREIHSAPFANQFENIHVVNDIIKTGNVTLVPWLIDDEWKKIKNLDTKYVFGHFELPHFMMNAVVAMPDSGELNEDHFSTVDMVFSGHFHKRQIRGKIHYIGNPFPHNYSDAWDDERGCVFLKWGEQPEYVDYIGPRYINIKLSDLIDTPEKYLNEKTYCRAVLDIPISYEEVNFVKETYIQQFNLRELSLIPGRKDEVLQESNAVNADNNITIESVDQIVFTQLQSVESSLINKKLLLDIYNNL